MDNNTFIDKKTLEIVDDAVVFNVDKEIAETISILNKKGYKTLASCASHFQILFNEERNCTDFEFLEKIKNDKRVIIKRLDEESYDYWYEITENFIYILFDKEYEFEIMPEGFKVSDNSIKYLMSYYKVEFSVRKSEEEYNKEKEYYLKNLNNWAKELPVIEERKR